MAAKRIGLLGASRGAARSTASTDRYDPVPAANAVDLYDDNAEKVAILFEMVSFEIVHGRLVDLLPPCPATVLDVGAGSGRDAAWLANGGYDVVAVEPSASMRSIARRLHPDTSIRWIDDSLPGLDVVTQSGLSFDVILLSGVWMHIPVPDRPRAFRRLVALLKPGGILAMTFRGGPASREKHVHPVSMAEIEALARDHGAITERITEAVHRLGRDDVHWTQVALRLSDEAAGA